MVIFNQYFIGAIDSAYYSVEAIDSEWRWSRTRLRASQFAIMSTVMHMQCYWFRLLQLRSPSSVNFMSHGFSHSIADHAFGMHLRIIMRIHTCEHNCANTIISYSIRAYLHSRCVFLATAAAETYTRNYLCFSAKSYLRCNNYEICYRHNNTVEMMRAELQGQGFCPMSILGSRYCLATRIRWPMINMHKSRTAVFEFV